MVRAVGFLMQATRDALCAVFSVPSCAAGGKVSQPFREVRLAS